MSTETVRTQALAEMGNYVNARRVDPSAEPPAGLVAAREYIEATLAIVDTLNRNGQL